MNKKLKFGNFLNIKVEDTFSGRAQLHELGLHLHIGYGISYDLSEPEAGVDAVIISGGYHDEISEDGNYIKYEGMGGKTKINETYINKKGEEKTREKYIFSHDQTLTRGNKALLTNENRGIPVRVFQKLKNGDYKYKGLFQITSHNPELGKWGFQVYKFHLAKVIDSLEFYGEESQESSTENETVVIRKGKWVNFISRQTKKAKEIKELYAYKCQICDTSILNFAEQFYVEGAHIKGLGYPHNGPDEKFNILSLCPNHHKQFDRGAIVLEMNSDTKQYDVISVLDFDATEHRVVGALSIHDDHAIDERMIKYHYDFVLNKRKEYLDKAK